MNIFSSFVFPFLLNGRMNQIMVLFSIVFFSFWFARDIAVKTVDLQPIR